MRNVYIASLWRRRWRWHIQVALFAVRKCSGTTFSIHYFALGGHGSVSSSASHSWGNIGSIVSSFLLSHISSPLTPGNSFSDNSNAASSWTGCGRYHRKMLSLFHAINEMFISCECFSIITFRSIGGCCGSHDALKLLRIGNIRLLPSDILSGLGYSAAWSLIWSMGSGHLLQSIQRNLLLTPLLILLHLLKALVLLELARCSWRTLHVLRKLSWLGCVVQIKRCLEVVFLIQSAATNKHCWSTDCWMVTCCWSMTRRGRSLAQITTTTDLTIVSPHIFIGDFWLPMFLLPWR